MSTAEQGLTPRLGVQGPGPQVVSPTTQPFCLQLTFQGKGLGLSVWFGQRFECFLVSFLHPHRFPTTIPSYVPMLFSFPKDEFIHTHP